MKTNAADLEELSAAVLGHTQPWRAGEGAFEAFCDHADAHGVLPLVAEQMDGLATPACRRHLDDRLRPRVAADLVRERELVRLLAALREAGVIALVIKGAQLAYSVYSRPDLRPRTDTDLLISAEDAGKAGQALQSLEYRAVPQLTADLVMYQRPYERRYGGRIAHTVDLHWRLSNPQRFGDALPYAGLVERARPIPALGPGAWGPGNVDALLIACIHRIAHHLDAERLVWIYDIHLLAEALAPRDWSELALRARECQAALACHRGLASAREHFGTNVPARAMDELVEAAGSERSIEAYLDDRSGHIARIVEDVRSMGSARLVLRLARQHVLPPAAYMREVYAPDSSAPLPWLYARRAWLGARRWLNRS